MGVILELEEGRSRNFSFCLRLISHDQWPHTHGMSQIVVLNHNDILWGSKGADCSLDSSLLIPTVCGTAEAPAAWAAGWGFVSVLLAKDGIRQSAIIKPINLGYLSAIRRGQIMQRAARS